MEKENSHIVIFVPGFAADELDYNCIPSIQYFVLNLKDKAPEKAISIITFEYPFKEKNYTWNGIPVYAIGGKSKKNFWKILTWFKVFLCFRKIHKAKKVSTIQSFWLRECTLIGLLLSKLYALNFVATLQGQESQKGNWYLRLFHFFKIKVVSNSEFNAKIYAESTNKTCEKIIPFGVDSERLYKQVPFYSGDRSIDIIGLGSLLPVKNFKLFVEIIAELKKDFPNIQVKIIGGGPQLILLQQKIIAAGLTENIEMLGFVESRAEVLTQLSKSKILLHTSTHEGQCYAFMEAYAYGLQLVSFDVGFIPNTPKSHICNSKADMIRIVKELLSAPINNQIEEVLSMKESLSQFIPLLK